MEYSVVQWHISDYFPQILLRGTRREMNIIKTSIVSDDHYAYY